MKRKGEAKAKEEAEAAKEKLEDEWDEIREGYRERRLRSGHNAKSDTRGKKAIQY